MNAVPSTRTSLHDMSVPPPEDETQLEFQDVDDKTKETQAVDEDEEMGEVESHSEPLAAALASGKTVTPAKLPEKRQKKEPMEFVREPGKSLFPIARVQKIIKADKVFL